MQKPPIPSNERERLVALKSHALLDTKSDPVLDQITKLASAIFKTPISLVSLIDESRQFFKSRVGVDKTETPRDISICAHAINGDDVLVVEDTHEDPRFFDSPLITGEPHIRFYAGAPLVTSDGFALGTLCVIDDQLRTKFTKNEQEVLRELADMAVAHIESLSASGYVDTVTGVSGRSLLLNSIEQHIGADRQRFLSVLVIDVLEPEEYESLISSLGYAYADTYLVAAAKIIIAALGPGNKLFHISGFRFACLQYSEAETQGTLKKIAALLQEPINCGELSIRTDTAIGVATYPNDGHNSLELLRAAVHAAHDARIKQASWVEYEQQTDLAYGRSYQLLNDLTHTIREPDQLRLMYQPKIDLRNGKCNGVEALIRWTHPELGEVAPAEFIPLAEKTTLMRPLTAWVLAEAIAQLKTWQAEGIDVQVAVNVSVSNLEDEGFLENLMSTMRRHALDDHSRIELELTEGALINDLEMSQRQLKGLHEHGISIAIDDFGTGYSAMSYLKHLDVTAIKLDQSFVRTLDSDPQDQVIVRSLVELAHSLALEVVAEGVENKDSLELLRAMSCDMAQGYYIAEPLDPVAFSKWFKAHSTQVQD